MEIKKAEFVTSLTAYRDFPGKGLPEIAFRAAFGTPVSLKIRLND